MSWIRTLPYAQATGRLKALYERVKGPQDNVDNVLLAHSLRPHTLEGHLALYKSVLHHADNRLPRWWLETVGAYVSLLNGCGYCVAHHFAGLRRLVRDEARARAIRAALEGEAWAGTFDARERAMLRYARQLTQAPAQVDQSAVRALRAVGLDDGRILELNQVVSYFAYANRTVLGLGVTTKGDVLGSSPA